MNDPHRQDDWELWELLGKAERKKAPAGFAEAVMKRIAEEQPSSASCQPEIREQSWGISWKVWISAAAAVITVGLFLFSALEPTSQGVDELAVADQVDDSYLVGAAYESLGSETLRDAVCLFSSQDSMEDMSDTEIAQLVF